MTAAVLAMPDDPDAVPAWLERELVGADLPRLVAELAAVHPESRTAADLDALLGEDREVLLARGLAAVPRRVVSALLTSPAVLPDLQSLVYEHGGPHWDRVMAATDAAEPAEDVRRAAIGMVLTQARRPARTPRWLSYAGVSAATAAAVLVAVALGGGFRTTPPVSNGWGFARVKELPRDAGPKAVFNQLADFAAEWEKKRPDDAAGLGQRLSEFRQGCTALQLADDLPLPAPDREWLAARCAEWSAEIDAHLRRLEATRDVAGVRGAATATARRIAAELRDRAG